MLSTFASQSFLSVVGKGPLPGVTCPRIPPSGWLSPTSLMYEPGATLVPSGRASVLAGHPEHRQASGLSLRVIGSFYPSYTSLVGRGSLMAGFLAAFFPWPAIASKISVRLQASQCAPSGRTSVLAVHPEHRQAPEQDRLESRRLRG